MEAQLNQEIICEMTLGPLGLPATDGYHFDQFLSTSLDDSLEYCQAWLANITTACQAHARLIEETLLNSYSSAKSPPEIDANQGSLPGMSIFRNYQPPFIIEGCGP